MADPLEPVRQVKRGVNGAEAVLDDGRKVELADFPERVAARFLDPVTVFLFVLGTFAIVMYRLLATISFVSSPLSDDYLAQAREDVQNFSLIVSLVVFGVIALYEISATTLPEQTRGKARRGLRVVSVDGAAALSLGRAWLRGLVPAAAGMGGSVVAALADFRYPALGGLVLWFVVYLSANWGKAGRGWHDILAGTVVINDPEPPR